RRAVPAGGRGGAPPPPAGGGAGRGRRAAGLGGGGWAPPPPPSVGGGGFCFFAPRGGRLLLFGSLRGLGALGRRRGGGGVGLARTAKYHATAVPVTSDSATRVSRAATAGLRRHQRQPRPSIPTGRAQIGSPAWKRRRSSANSAALP